MSNKEQQKDEIISIVKKAIAANSYIALSDDRVIPDCNGVDHIAEEVADAVYNFYKPIDNEPVGALGECEKKTVKEFAEKLKEKAHKGASNDAITYKFIERDYTITESELNELLKEYEK